MLPLHSPHGKAPHLHPSQFSSSEIFYKITSAFLKTGINLRNLPPAHSRGAVTFSGLCNVVYEDMIEMVENDVGKLVCSYITSTTLLEGGRGWNEKTIFHSLQKLYYDLAMSLNIVCEGL